ncbi:Polymerase/histidinol phosphatase N-terminal domain-containing protein [Frankia sp. AiPs1]|uniref:PHP domain-containing protein n=1 Tax=Frankia sp. AiPa1 TaxID=573492 RepID=UPI00202B3352|nr:hypothetical protein [Frankia sp. AiPa1]MCL9759284.1 hypothetical protein [Frankia sp. AiPa1]
MAIDLHLETSCSGHPGEFPEVLVSQAARAGAEIVAIADRYTMEGLDAARRALPSRLTLLPAVTVPCAVVVQEEYRTIELRGYLINPQDRLLLDLIGRARTQRENRARTMVAMIAADHPRLTWLSVTRQSSGPIPGRPAIARALLHHEIVASLTRAYSSDWIGTGGRYFLPKRQPGAGEALTAIRAAGGVPILGWPRRPHRVQLTAAQIADLKHAGLAGLEADHPVHPRPAREMLHRIAAEHNLIVTGGSGSRGHTSTRSPRITAAVTQKIMYERILAAGTGSEPITSPLR